MAELLFSSFPILLTFFLITLNMFMLLGLRSSILADLSDTILTFSFVIVVSLPRLRGKDVVLPCRVETKFITDRFPLIALCFCFGGKG